MNHQDNHYKNLCNLCSSVSQKVRALAWPEALVWLGLVGMIADAWGPWVAHANAGMALNVIDLVEFVKFMTRAKLTFIVRELFYLPMLAGAIGIVIEFRISNSEFRIPLAVLAGLVALVPLPPYPNLLHAYRSPEDGPSFWLSLGTLGLVVAAASLGRRLPRRASAGAPLRNGAPFLNGVLLCLACSALPAVWQFVRLSPALAVLYGAPVQAGWGLALTGLSSLSLAVGAMMLMANER